MALRHAGFPVVAVAGRSVAAPSTRRAAAALGAPARPVEEAGQGARVVIVAVPDGAIAPVAAAVAPSLERRALVVHLAGSLGLEAFDALRERRPDVRRGAAHPLQTLTGAPGDLDRLRDAWFAVEEDGGDGDDGDVRTPAVADLVVAAGGRPFAVRDRAGYHAAAVVAANHLVALVGQVERLATASGAPLEAFAPLLRASLENAIARGAAEALTGPVARGDAATVERHLRALPVDERPAYRALAREALRLTGRSDPAIEVLLGDEALPARSPA